jgi:arylsulfatase A-like enzyme
VLVGQPTAQGGSPAAGDTTAGQVQAGADDRPNVVLILTDDMTNSDLRFMPHVRKLIGRPGVTFPNMLSPHPLCCPARAAILTGQYAQNNHVKANQGQYAFPALDSQHTLPVWLNRAGYRTAFTGKYLNGYGTQGKPQPGWTYWDPTIVGMYAYEGYKMYRDGSPVYYSDLNNVDYINNQTEALIREWAPDPQPFFIWASHVAPHGRVDPTTGRATAVSSPPKRFRHLFRHTNPPSMKDPGFNENIDDKTKWLRHNHPKKLEIAHVKHVFRSRIQSLQGVDEGVARIVKELREVGELDNTLLIFTSDNGFMLGEHRLLTKNVPYKQSIGVPLLMRGPGVPRHKTRNESALMIDLAPTIADVARAHPDLKVDGTSLMPTVKRDKPLRTTVLIQAGPQEKVDRKYGWWWRGVTTGRYTYAYY